MADVAVRRGGIEPLFDHERLSGLAGAPQLLLELRLWDDLFHPAAEDSQLFRGREHRALQGLAVRGSARVRRGVGDWTRDRNNGPARRQRRPPAVPDGAAGTRTGPESSLTGARAWTGMKAPGSGR